MKNLKFLSLFFTILFSTTSLANICEFYFKYNKHGIYGQDIKLTSKITSIEKKINFVRKLGHGKNHIDSDAVRVVHKKWKEEFLQMESHIFQGSNEFAFGRLRTIYADMNRTSARLEKYNILIKNLEDTKKFNGKSFGDLLVDLKLPERRELRLLSLAEKGDKVRVLKRLNKYLRHEYRVLGKRYDRYYYFQSNLENLANSKECKKKCLETIQDFYQELASPLKANSVKKLFYSHPEAVVIARRKEFLQELIGVAKQFLDNSNFYGKVKDIFRNNLQVRKSRFLSIVGGKLDDDARRTHKSIVTKVVASELTVPQKLNFLKKELAENADDGLLVNFSRYPDYKTKDTWNKMSDYASRRRNKSFYNKMKEAEQIGEKLGEVGSARLRSNIIKAIIGASVGGLGIMYFLSDPEDGEIIEEELTPEEKKRLRLRYNSREDIELEETLMEFVDTIQKAE